MVRFLGFELGAAVHRWASWAEQEVQRWRQVRDVEPNRRALEDYLRLAEDQLATAEAADPADARPRAGQVNSPRPKRWGPT
jgi:hypothetical protein